MDTVLSAIGLALGFGFAVSAVQAARILQQRESDKNRRRYSAALPNDLTYDQVLNFGRSLAGLPRPRLFKPSHSVVLETYSDSSGIRHMLSIPGHLLADVEALFRTHLDGSLIPLDEVAQTWDYVRELRLTSPSIPLQIGSPEAVTASILSAFSTLKADQAVLMQWVITPAHPTQVSQKERTRWPFKERDQSRFKDKLSDVTFLGVGRLAARGEDAEGLVRRMYGNLASLHTYGLKFKQRLVPRRLLLGRIARQTTSISFPVHLNAAELAAISGVPFGGPNVAGLPTGRSRHMPPDPTIPETGIILGRSNFPGAERPVAISARDLNRHLHVVGSTGCLHPDTSILDPVDGSSLTVRQRAEIGRPFHVFALDGKNIIVAQADAPKRYTLSRMYEFTSSAHRIVVTGEHRFWTGSRYETAAELLRHQPSAVVQLPTISESSLSGLLRDAQRSKRTAQGCPDDHRQVCRSCDARPLSEASSARSFAPSLTCDDALCCSSFGTDDLGCRSGGSPLCLSELRPSMSRSSPPWNPDPSTEARQLLGTSRPRSGSNLTDDESQVRLSPHGIALHTDQSAPLSIYAGQGHALVRSLPSTSVPSNKSFRLDGIFHQRRSHRPQVALSDHVCADLSLTPLLPFDYYSNINTFTVKQVDAETYYDLHVPRFENYYACGVFNHNTGKSTALESLAIQMMDQGHGITFIDPHGDAIANLMDRLPKHRLDDVILLDLTDAAFPVGFNVLEGDPYVVTNQLMAVFDKLYNIFQLTQTADVLRSTTLTLAQRGMTLLDIPAVLNPTPEGQRLRDHLLTDLRDPALKDFWRQYEGLKPEVQMNQIGPVLRRLRPFETWPSLRGCLGQVKSGFDLDEVLKGNKIVLVNLSKGRLGEEEAKLFGSLFVAKFWSAVQRRAAIPEDERTPHFLIIDEFQNYTNLHVNFGDVLAEARKYGLGFIIAHQHLSQLPHELREAVMPNARNKLFMQMSAGDAAVFAKEMPLVKPEDLQNLGRYEALGRLLVDDRVMSPVTFTTPPPIASRNTAQAVRALSQAKYGTPIARVEAELQARHKVARAGRRKPDVGRVNTGSEV